jgi:cation diffusion facilitator CzcD-associated flavoprotein CzcO
VDIRADPIRRITETGLDTAGGHHELDVIVFATGFDAMTGSLLRPEIVGRDGVTLKEAWSAGPVTYLGLGVPGFPNLFIIAGPGSPSLLANVIVGIEQHVDWLAELLAHAAEQGAAEIEVDADAARNWVEHVNERAGATLYPQARSYYMGDEMPGKPRVFMPYVGGLRGYGKRLAQVAEAGYEGFVLRPAPMPASTPAS